MRRGGTFYGFGAGRIGECGSLIPPGLLPAFFYCPAEDNKNQLHKIATGGNAVPVSSFFLFFFVATHQTLF